MALGFGLLSAQLRPGESDWTRAYDETIRLAVEVERLGMSSIWTTEHHFVDDGYMPSLLVVSAAIAAVTSSIEIGTGVILAPLHHPLRLAEGAATVSILSRGRLTLGLGLGWSGIEFEGLGAEKARRGAAMEEILTILPQAWTGKPFHHQGKVYRFPELAVRPTPVNGIPILIGGGAEAAVRRAARLADGIYANVPPNDLMRQLGWIRDECERVGRDHTQLRIVYYAVLLPGRSVEEAKQRYARHVWHMTWKYSDMEASATRSGPLPAAPEMRGDHASLPGRFNLAGESERLVSTLLDIRERAQLPVEFVARSYLPTLEYQQQLELMQQLAEDVAPHL